MTELAADTRDRILDAAERLFMERGFEATSMRTIAAEASANLAAANYHFGSKDGLYRAVFARRLAGLNAQRVALLDEMEAAAGGAPLRPSQIVEAFFGTLLAIGEDSSRGGMTFLRLIGRTLTQPSDGLHAFFAGEYAEVVERYKRALFYALPEVPEPEIAWRFHFMLGAMSYAIAGTDALRILGAMEVDAGGNDDATVAKHLRARLMPFLLGGLRAPLPDWSVVATATVPKATRTGT